MKKFISLLVALCISFSVVPQMSLIAYASEASGTCGDNLTWELVGDTLTISGDGKMEDFTVSESLDGSPAPWLIDYTPRKVVIEEGVTTIGTYAFAGMYISSLELPKSLKNIKYRAFYRSHFDTKTSDFVVHIPAGVSNIAEDAFYCSGVARYDVADDNEYFCDYEGHLLSKDKKTFIRFADDYRNIDDEYNDCYTIPYGVTKVCSRAFYGCYLDILTITHTVSEIGNFAFGGYQLESIVVVEENPYFLSENGVLYTKDKTELIRYPARKKENSYSIPTGVTKISSGAFEAVLEGVYEIDIPETVQIIGDGAFYDTAIGDIAIPHGVTAIEEATFMNSAIQNIYLPSTVTTIKIDAFKNCYRLKNFYYGGSQDDIKSLKVANDGFGSNDAVKNATIHYNSIPADAIEYKVPQWYSESFDYAISKSEDGKAEFDYHDYYFVENDWGFDGSSYTYNEQLARISMRLALSAFAKIKNNDYSKQYINAENLLDNMGYKNIEHNSEYEKKATKDSIGVIAGHKKVNFNGDKCTIIAVAIRGGNYEMEWKGNFNMGGGATHIGFSLARNQVLQFIKDYITNVDNDIDGSIKLWITGYSRAAATANLTAAWIGDNLKMFGDNVSFANGREDIYAYCFETPAGTSDDNRNSGLYRHIFNIVNQNDFVPMLVMDKWDFGRYGVTKYIPTALTMNSRKFKTKQDEMLKLFKQYAPENANKYLIDDFVSAEHGHNFGIFMSETMDSLAEAIEKPINYSVYFEDALVELAGGALGNDSSKLDIFLNSLSSKLNKDKKLLTSTIVMSEFAFGPFVGTGLNYVLVRTYLIEALNDAGIKILDASKIDKLVVLAGELFINGTFNLISKNENFVDMFKQTHSPALCMAWVDVLEDKDFTSGKLRAIHLNCPVDIEVYDSEGALTASIINNVPQEIEGSTMVAFVDENGQKIIYLPKDEEYQIKVKATSDGNVTYSIQETDLETGEIKVTNYSNMSLKENDELLGTAENLSEGEANYPLLLNTEAVIPEVIETAESYIVNVEIDGNGFTEGGGTFYKGEYAIVEAAPLYDNETFSGWYNGDELVSMENEYRFAVENNTTLTAKFTTNTCEVVFVADDEIVSSTQIANGATTTAPEAPEKNGYNFDGWYLDKEYTKTFDETIPFTNGAVIYAKYAVVTIEPTPTPTPSRSGGGGGISTYTIKFETNGGNEIESVKVANNKTLDEPEIPTKDGFSFEGWFTDKELTTAYNFDSKVTKSFTLYAKWEKHDDEKPVEFENPFTDVEKDDWCYEDVLYAVKSGLFNGITESEFSPNTSLTRAMLVTVLYRAEGEPEVTNEIIFDDIDKDSYYEKAVMWAEKNGIANGISKTEFAPDQNITREQIAAIMHRYAQYKEYDVSIGENTNILSYDDFDNISVYAIVPMQYAVGSGLMKGKTTSTLNPLDSATRAEIAAILHRFIEANK